MMIYEAEVSPSVAVTTTLLSIGRATRLAMDCPHAHVQPRHVI